MRGILLLAMLIVQPTLAWTAQQGDACEGELWRKVEAWLEPTANFTETTAFLRSQSIHYAVMDSRPPSFFKDQQFVPNPEPYDAVDCQPRDEIPNCSIVTSEPMPKNKPTFASLPDLANLVRADELISIDFKADGSLIGYSCEVVLTGP